MHQAALRTFCIRWFVLPALTMLAVLGLAGTSSGKSLADATASSAQNGALKAHVSVGKTAMRRTGRQCRAKGKRATAARPRACRRTQTQLPAVAGPTMVTTSSPESNDDPPSGNPADSPADSPGVTPRCDLVEGDCGIYSDAFWELQAKYEAFELDTGVYPMPPACMEAAAEGKSVGCAQVITYLYPDGTVGSSPWVVDPEASGGWRFWEPEPPAEDDPPPGVTPRCELVPGDCSIYSDQFWELQAKYQRFEIATAVYPYPPGCMEAWENGEPISCIAALAFLYPDGTIGTSHWFIDPCSPKGWRFWEPDPPSC